MFAPGTPNRQFKGFMLMQANELAEKASNLERKQEEIRSAGDASRAAIPSEERELDEAKARVREVQDALNPAK